TRFTSAVDEVTDSVVIEDPGMIVIGGTGRQQSNLSTTSRRTAALTPQSVVVTCRDERTFPHPSGTLRSPDLPPKHALTIIDYPARPEIKERSTIRTWAQAFIVLMRACYTSISMPSTPQ